MLPEEKSYNCRLKTYSDGTQLFSRFPVDRGRDDKVPRKAKLLVSSDEKKRSNLNQAKERVFDIVRENDFDVFITTTFNPDIVDSFDYGACCDEIKRFTRVLRERDIDYILVPELHESGRIHFHGALRGELPLVPAYSAKDGRELFDKFGRRIYNVPVYTVGFTTATYIDDQSRVASYVAKYITKAQDWLPKGKKAYWVSRGLARPVVSKEYLYPDDVTQLVSESHYTKALSSPIGCYYLFERGGDSGLRSKQNKYLTELTLEDQPEGER